MLSSKYGLGWLKVQRQQHNYKGINMEKSKAATVW